MSNLILKDVTLACVDGRGDSGASNLLEQISTHINFYDVKLITGGVDSVEKYSDFVVHDLNDHVESEFCMLVQTEGYPQTEENRNALYLPL